MIFRRVLDKVRMLEKLAGYASKHRVLVGVPAEAGEHEGGITNAALGYLFEYGSPETNMPPRPWLLPGVRLAQPAIRKELVAGYGKAVTVILRNGTMQMAIAELTRSQHKVGLIAQNAIRGRIQQGIAPPLAPRTVYARLHRKKNRRSGGSMTPLIDTGQFIRSITYVIT